VFAQRRRGQAAASSLCRSEQRRQCDLTAASFCPLPRGIIVVIDSHHHQVRLVRFLRLRFPSAKERKKKEEPPKEPAAGFGETIDFVRFSESLLGERVSIEAASKERETLVTFGINHHLSFSSRGVFSLC